MKIQNSERRCADTVSEITPARVDAAYAMMSENMAQKVTNVTIPRRGF